MLSLFRRAHRERKTEMAPSAGDNNGDRVRKDAGAGQNRADRFLQASVSPIDRLVGSGLTGIAVDHTRDHSALLRRVDNVLKTQPGHSGPSINRTVASSADKSSHNSNTSRSAQGSEGPPIASEVDAKNAHQYSRAR